MESAVKVSAMQPNLYQPFNSLQQCRQLTGRTSKYAEAASYNYWKKLD